MKKTVAMLLALMLMACTFSAFAKQEETMGLYTLAEPYGFKLGSCLSFLFIRINRIK